MNYDVEVFASDRISAISIISAGQTYSYRAFPFWMFFE